MLFDNKYTQCISIILICTVYMLMQVNNNGIITFNNAYSAYIPQVFPLSVSNVSLLALYWADSDTRPSNGGFVYYRETTDAPLLSRASNQIGNTFSLSSFQATHLFIATWHAIGYFSQHTDKVHKRCVLIHTVHYVTNVIQ